MSRRGTWLFLSTPSARRATAENQVLETSGSNFYPRPPRGGRPYFTDVLCISLKISIHALREEGDEGNEKPKE